jgi:nucleoporin SEH1
MEFTQLTTSSGTDCLVHDIVFDYYGRRFATCSTDGKIRVWDCNDEEDSNGSSGNNGGGNNGSGWTHAEISEVGVLFRML